MLEFELRDLEQFTTWAQTRRCVPAWIEEHNNDRHHSGIGRHNPASVHFGTASEVRAQQQTLDATPPSPPRQEPDRIQSAKRSAFGRGFPCSVHLGLGAPLEQRPLEPVGQEENHCGDDTCEDDDGENSVSVEESLRLGELIAET